MLSAESGSVLKASWPQTGEVDEWMSRSFRFLSKTLKAFRITAQKVGVYSCALMVVCGINPVQVACLWVSSMSRLLLELAGRLARTRRMMGRYCLPQEGS